MTILGMHVGFRGCFVMSLTQNLGSCCLLCLLGLEQNIDSKALDSCVDTTYGFFIIRW